MLWLPRRAAPLALVLLVVNALGIQPLRPARRPPARAATVLAGVPSGTRVYRARTLDLPKDTPFAPALRDTAFDGFGDVAHFPGYSPAFAARYLARSGTPPRAHRSAA